MNITNDREMSQNKINKTKLSKIFWELEMETLKKVFQRNLIKNFIQRKHYYISFSID